MIYTQLTMSPATIEFARSFGATGLHIGILGALPTGMLFLQFLSALTANRLRYRRRVWFWVTLAQRLLFLPLALGPWLAPGLSEHTWLWLLIGLTALNHGLIHFSTPLWLSWMGDYLPHRGLSHYWGRRHAWMQMAAAVSLFAGALYMLGDASGIRSSFGVLLVVEALDIVADEVGIEPFEQGQVFAQRHRNLGRLELEEEGYEHGRHFASARADRQARQRRGVHVTPAKASTFGKVATAEIY